MAIGFLRALPNHVDKIARAGRISGGPVSRPGVGRPKIGADD
jgi:hypothetical protein